MGYLVVLVVGIVIGAVGITIVFYKNGMLKPLA